MNKKIVAGFSLAAVAMATIGTVFLVANLHEDIKLLMQNNPSDSVMYFDLYFEKTFRVLCMTLSIWFFIAIGLFVPWAKQNK